MSKNIVNVGVIGFGVVGSSTVKTIIDNASTIKIKTGIDINVYGVADLNIDRRENDYLKDVKIITKNATELINDENIDIIVELIGGTGIAKDFILKAIEKGKHIVTANKALLAKHGKEIFDAVTKKGVAIGFEASVGGGIPILKVIKEDLVANNVNEIYGIINGTCNYILTRMSQEGKAFDDVLKDAQENGYAEYDPTFDVEGIDAAHKITLLSSLAFSNYVDFDKVYVEGITDISTIDIDTVKEFNSTIKLLAIAKNHKDKIEVRVHPTIIPNSAMLSKVNGVFNAIMLSCDKLGTSMHYGKGAGGDATSSAVVGDIVAISRDIMMNSVCRVSPIGFIDKGVATKEIINIDDVSSSFYLRFMVVDKVGVLATICKALADNNISVHEALQRDSIHNGVVPLVFMTHLVKSSQIKNAVEEIEKLGITTEKSMVIRIENLD